MTDFKAKCTKFDFGWGAYNAPDPLAGFGGGHFAAGEGLGWGRGGKGECNCRHVGHMKRNTA